MATWLHMPERKWSLNLDRMEQIVFHEDKTQVQMASGEWHILSDQEAKQLYQLVGRDAPPSHYETHGLETG